MVEDGMAVNKIWKRSLSAKPADVLPSAEYVASLWSNNVQDSLGESIIVNTTGVVLLAHGIANSQDDAVYIAKGWWASRNK
jgi:hypothetical protein